MRMEMEMETKTDEEDDELLRRTTTLREKMPPDQVVLGLGPSTNVDDIASDGDGSSSSSSPAPPLELELIGSLASPDHVPPWAQPWSPETERRVFSCKFCERSFFSPQALGGHQNAHKFERNLAKGRASCMFPASRVSLPGLHGPRYAVRPLGIQVHYSVVDKPSFYGWPAAGPEASTGGAVGGVGGGDPNLKDEELTEVDLSLKLWNSS